MMNNGQVLGIVSKGMDRDCWQSMIGWPLMRDCASFRDTKKQYFYNISSFKKTRDVNFMCITMLLYITVQVYFNQSLNLFLFTNGEGYTSMF